MRFSLKLTALREDNNGIVGIEGRRWRNETKMMKEEIGPKPGTNDTWNWKPIHEEISKLTSLAFHWLPDVSHTPSSQRKQRRL